MPDLTFVSNENLPNVKETLYEGAPDLVVEIVSPESQERDWDTKYNHYESSGVKEYWVIDRDSEKAEIFVLDDGGQYQHTPLRDGKLHSTVIPGLWVKPSWFWTERPGVVEILRELGVV